MTAMAPTAAPAPPGAATLPGRLLALAALRPRDVAMRLKELGVWRSITWAEYAAHVEALGAALVAGGVEPGDRVLLLSENRPEWLVSDLAVQGAGAVTVGPYASTPAPEVAALLERIGAVAAVVEDHRQLDKVLAARGPALRLVVVVDVHGVGPLAPGVLDLRAIVGAPMPPEPWRARVGALAPGDAAAIVLTPGTTGTPKAAMLTHGSLAAAASASVEALGLRADDDALASLPLCDVAGRLVASMQALHAGYSVSFGEGGASFDNDLREVQPTYFVAVPRVWDRMRAGVEGRMRGAGALKRAAFRSGTRGGLGRALVVRPLRRKLGLGRVRVAISCSAHLEAGVAAAFAALGVDVREAYGLTESSGVATVASTGERRGGSVGRPVAGVELRLATGGEVLLRGPNVFAGYLGDDAATAVALDDDGWLHTGDVGEVDGDELVLTGRLKDIVITSDGVAVAPRAVERRLVASPFVAEAVVVGEGRPCLGALIGIDGDAVGDWAAAHDVSYTTYRDLTDKAEVRALVAECIEQANAAAVETERVQRFELLPTRLSHLDGDLTPTFKLRRAATRARFAPLIERMYGSAGEAVDRGEREP